MVSLTGRIVMARNRLHATPKDCRRHEYERAEEALDWANQSNQYGEYAAAETYLNYARRMLTICNP